ncbi:MAG: CPBP family intramembrane metalloprotease [Planctomycetota bacterium]|jgi:membrane protease YdiL (CAAX protease family)|nr:CPBP family intramembrane metalloprotease [Planctomycetota bacterium]MDP6940486.1 CPBP family intramembrane metalloprotease [Planctomycetota bacterium]
MSWKEAKRLGAASQDSAVTFLLLLPLALIHLSGWRLAKSGAFSLVESTLRWFGSPAYWALGAILALLLFWAIGRIKEQAIAWRGGSALVFLEGVLWGAALGPVLHSIMEYIPASGLAWSPHLSEGMTLHGALALAAGAGLYEELLFRAFLLGGLFILFKTSFYAIGWREAGPTIALFLSFVASSALFALAHAWGDPSAMATSSLIYRFLAGILLGAIFATRGIAVAAWAHASYDAILIL